MQGDKEVVNRKHQSMFFNDEVALPKKLSSNSYRVLNLLTTGEYTVVEITKELDLSDPRSNIRNLRKAGYPISDYWINIGKTKCKRFFLNTTR